MTGHAVRLGLRENRAQFALLVAINAFVGAMVGLERSTLPLIGREDFGLASSAAVLSFIVAFGVAKALTNLAAGVLAARVGRRRLLIAGWAFALPVPLLIAVAPSWGWIVAANALLGVNQGLAWSMTVVMKIDLVGPKRSGLALGLNESAGYGGVALAAGISGWLAADLAARDVLVVAGAVIAVVAFLCSVLFVRDTAAHVALEQTAHEHVGDSRPPTLRVAFPQATYREPTLRSCSQAGLVNNLNDALAWGLVPLFLAAHGASVADIGLVAAPLSGGLERRADRNRSLVRHDRSQAADRRGHAHPGRRAGPARPQRRRARACRGRGRLPRPRDRAGLPHADRRDVRRRLTRRPRARRRRLSLLARQRLRPGRSHRWRYGRCARLWRRHRPRRGTDRRLGPVGASRHACSPWQRRAATACARAARRCRDRRRGRASRAALNAEPSGGPPHSRVSASRRVRNARSAALPASSSARA